MSEVVDDVNVLRAVLENASEMVAISDTCGRLVHVNPYGLATLGLSELPSIEPLTMNDVFTCLRSTSTDDASLRPWLAQDAWQGPAELHHHTMERPLPVVISSRVVDRSPDDPNVIVAVVTVHDTAHDDDRWQAAALASRHLAAEQQAVAALSRLALDGALEELLQAATIAASQLMGVQRSMVTQPIDGDDDNISVVAFTGTPPRPVTLAAGHRSLMGFSLLTNSVVVCENCDEESRFSTAAMESFGFRSGVCVPISGGASPWGALSVHSNRNRTFSDRDVSFLQTVAGVLSAAIRRVDLDRQLRDRSMHDPLTGLANRSAAFDRIEHALRCDERDGTSTAVMVIDVDDFKIVNDSLGHEAGDRALIRFANRLAEAARPGDVVARVGGDEFLVIAERISGIDEARRIAQALTTAINAPHPPDGEPVPLSASIGIAVSSAASTRQELIHHADLAMYRAKDLGAGDYAIFDHEDLYDADRARRLSVDLRAALGDGELTLLYQPIVDISSGKFVAMEALARWTHPDIGVVHPTEFVAVAERTGIVNDLGEWALQSACTQTAAWREDFDVGVRVNVSALQLRDPAFVAKVGAVLASTGLEPTALGLEITETVWVSDTAVVAATLGALHQLGVGISLDDLGQGYSSIAYLSRYPVFECFKIDKSYISGLPAARAKVIVAAIVMLARAFDLTVVGEGVETFDQLEALRDCGCDLAQGFLLGEPMTAARVTAELSRQAHP